MFLCPVCRSARIVLMIGATRRAFCTGCGARWTQDGLRAKAVEPVAVALRRDDRMTEHPSA